MASKTTKRGVAHKTTAQHSVIPPQLPTDQPADVGLFFARGALGIAAFLFVGSLAFALSYDQSASSRESVLGTATMQDVASPEEEARIFNEKLSLLQNQYDVDVRTVRAAVSGDLAMDGDLQHELIAHLTEYRTVLAQLRVPQASQDEYFALVADVDTLLEQLGT